MILFCIHQSSSKFLSSSSFDPPFDVIRFYIDLLMLSPIAHHHHILAYTHLYLIISRFTTCSRSRFSTFKHCHYYCNFSRLPILIPLKVFIPDRPTRFDYIPSDFFCSDFHFGFSSFCSSRLSLFSFFSSSVSNPHVCRHVLIFIPICSNV